MKFRGLPQIKDSKTWQMLGRDFQVVFRRIKCFIGIFILYENGSFSLQKDQKILNKKLIENRRRRQKHKQSQTVCKIILVKVRWKNEKKRKLQDAPATSFGNVAASNSNQYQHCLESKVILR